MDGGPSLLQADTIKTKITMSMRYFIIGYPFIVMVAPPALSTRGANSSTFFEEAILFKY